MTKFLQPFQFIPVKGIKDEQLQDYAEIRKDVKKHPARHDVFLQNSGRVICTLTLETPMILGLEHKKSKGKQQNTASPQQRSFGEESSYYIPGNSLKGLTSSIAEAITQSSFRVLEDKELKISFGPKKSRPLENVNKYFKSVSPNSLPLGADLRNSTKLTPAELLFGCIEMQGNNSSNQAFALASRVRFSDAKLEAKEENPLMEEILLKVLSTPKNNSHNLYYNTKKGSDFIEKGDLNSTDHKPNGRKFYLHATSSMVKNESWKVEPKGMHKPEMHVKAKPFKPGQTFTFHIDFDNLTDAELSVLITSLRPARDFRHKLGMGKPLGLGTVRIDTQGVYLIDRTSRYGKNALQQERYSQLFLDQNSELQEDCFKTTYQEEFKALSTLKKEDISINNELIDNESLEILKRIGKWPYSTQEDQYEIDYPYMENPKNKITGTGFEWFVRNEKAGGHQYLKNVEPDQPLPTLDRYLKQDS